MNHYDLAYLVAGALASPFWARKKRAGWSERFGKLIPAIHAKSADRPRVLLAPVSVGEVQACRALVPELIKNADVVLAVTTDTGIRRAHELFGETCTIVRYPLDFSWSVKRVLDAVQPDAVGLVELEVWPNMTKACRRRGIPIGVINGRLSARSFTGYRRGRFVIGRSFRRLSFVAAQDDAYAQRFRAMGVAGDRLSVTGSMKWDAVAVETGDPSNQASRALLAQLGVDTARPLVVAGSTGPGEEALLHEAVPENVQLVCAPRKPERFDDAASAMPGCHRRSLGSPAPVGTTRFLLDSIGELSTLYRAADLVVIGRSFGGLFGSDPTEPAGLGRPILIGPAHSDFAEAVRVMRESGAIEVVDRTGLGERIGDLLQDEAARATLGAAARSCVLDQQGASRRHAEMMLKLAELGSLLSIDRI